MDIQSLDILKWIGIVLAAGFVGYFGRYLAMLIIEKARRKKESAPPAVTPGDAVRIEDSSLKLEKKKAKQAAKQAKKMAKR